MPEVQTVFAEYGEEYEANHPMTVQQRKALHAIKLCRTSAMGGHMDECPECGFQRPSYNSCRNRHCYCHPELTNNSRAVMSKSRVVLS